MKTDLRRENLLRAAHRGVELREASVDDEGPPILCGHFVVFGEWSEINSRLEGHFLERIMPGSTKKTLAENRDRMRCLFQHGKDPQIGDKPLGPIDVLHEDEYGTRYEVPLFDTAYNAELLPGLRAKVYGSSYKFSVVKDHVNERPARSEHNPRGLPERSVTEMRVYEFGPVTFAQYVGATAGVRSVTDEFAFAALQEDPEELKHLVSFGRTLRHRDTDDAGEARDFADAYVDDNLHVRDGQPSERTYKRSIGYVSATPWACELWLLATIKSILTERANGVRLTKDEIRDRIGVREEQTDAPAPPSIAVIPIRGPIVPHAGTMVSMSSEGASIERMQQRFRDAMASNDVKAIVLNIDSPGGSVSLVPEFAAEVRAARGTKPIVAVANTFAASAAYFIASAADEIVVSPSGKVGSIGVYSVHTDISKAQEMAGEKVTFVSAGEHKVEGNPFEPLSPEAEAEMQATVDAYYAMFKSAVAKGRGVSVKKVEDDFGKGRMVMAANAVELGMADRVATFDETIARLEKTIAQEAKTAESADAADTGSFAENGNPRGVVVEIVGASRSGGGSGTNGSATGSRGGSGVPSDTSGTLPDQALPQTREAADGTSQPEPTDVTPEHGSRNKEVPDDSKETDVLTREEQVARIDEIKARRDEINDEYGTNAMPDSAWAEWDRLKAEQLELETAIADQDRRTAELKDLTRAGTDVAGRGEAGDGATASRTRNRARVAPENVYDLSTIRVSADNPDEMKAQLRDRALTVLDKTRFPEIVVADRAQQRIGALLDQDPDGDFAKRILITGDPAYKRAFGKAALRQPLTNAEEHILSRALSLTDSEGGYAVPFTLDPTVINTSNGVVNPLRSIAEVKSITTKEWKGVASDGVVAAYGTEGTEVAEDTPTFVQPEIIPERCATFVKFSFEVGGDFSGLQTELAKMFTQARDDVEAEKFAHGLGHGSKEPMGIVTVLAATPSSVFPTDAINTIALEDLDTLEDDLPPRARPMAQFVAARRFYQTIRALTGERTDVWTRIREGIPNRPTGNLGYALNGYAANELSTMSGAVTEGGENVAILGDWSRFVIVDRVGMSVELVPHLMGANRLPTGQRGLLAWWRNSSGVTDANAFRLLQIQAS